MNFGLNGKRALVTGASRGIGLAIAKALAREGACILACARSKTPLEEAIATLPDGEHQAVTCCDFMRPEAPHMLAQRALSFFKGPPDIIVHNVGGTLGIRGPFTGGVDWADVWRLNLGAAIQLNNALLPYMVKQQGGRVIHVSSLAGREHQGASIAYGVVKAAQLAYVRALGRELANSGVVVSAVIPGTVRTAGGTWDTRMTDDPITTGEYVQARLPQGRFQTVEEVAAVVAFLASDSATAFCGAAVPVDGGQGVGY